MCAHASSFAAVFTLARRKSMSLQKYFKLPLPTSQETGLGVSTTKTANERVQNVLDAEEKRAKKLRNELSTATKTEWPL